MFKLVGNFTAYGWKEVEGTIEEENNEVHRNIL